MEAATSAKPRREPPPIPPNYVSLQQLQELRLKEKEEEEKRQREEEAAAAAKREAALKAEEAAMAAAVKREAALKAETKGRAVSREAKERHRGGQGHQWVAVAHQAPATAPRSTPTCGEVAAGKRESMVGGNRSKKGLEDVADNAPNPHGGCKSPWKGKGKGKGKKKASSCHTVDEPVNLAEEAAPALSNGGKPEESEIKAMGLGKVSVTPLDPAKAAVASSPGHLTCKGRKGAGDRSAETTPGDAPAKMAGPSSPPGIKSGTTGKPNPAAPRLVDAGTGSETVPAQAPPTSAADGSSRPKSRGKLRKTREAKPEGLVEGQLWQPVVEVQAVTMEAKPERLVEGQRRQPAWVARRSAEPWRGRGDRSAEPHGRVWVPKAAAAGSSAGARDK